MIEMKLQGVTVTSRVEGLAAGIVVARDVTVARSSETLSAEIAEAIAVAPEDPGAPKNQVRDLLRFGKYKPTGRGKPASEYLLKAAKEDRFPAINNLVDINNLVSLSTLLPISLIDVDRAEDDAFVLRRGHAGESFVFNAGGQTIDLTDLLLVARAKDDLACANPVKDSLRTKLQDDASRVMAVIYAPTTLADRSRAATELFVRLLEREGATVEAGVIST